MRFTPRAGVQNMLDADDVELRRTSLASKPRSSAEDRLAEDGVSGGAKEKESAGIT